jgi:hypothetical protein
MAGFFAPEDGAPLRSARFSVNAEMAQRLPSPAWDGVAVWLSGVRQRLSSSGEWKS